MLKEKIQNLLNKQIAMEAQATYNYLAMASWCDTRGFSGASTFLYEHSDEERMHMLKFVRYINDSGGESKFTEISSPEVNFNSIQEVFTFGYAQEKSVTESIHKIADVCIKEQDHTTWNFIQWFIEEQLEEENLYRSIIDRIKLIGDGPNSLFLIDTEIGKLSKGSGGMEILGQSV